MSPDLLELPHTPGCLACGRDNPLSLKLSLHVNPITGIVTVDFSPTQNHIGFANIAHGGMLATVFDEAMVWAATWNQKRFCFCGELSVRFRRPATVGERLLMEAHVELSRPKLVQTAATIRTADKMIIAAATGKYVPMPFEQSEAVMRTLVPDDATRAAAEILTRG